LVNGSGVDLSHYDRADLPKDPIFLMIARVLGNKGVREFATAGIDVLKTYPDATFQLVGPAEEGPDGIDASEIQFWQDNGIQVLGSRDDVRPSLAACSIYVLPSYREGTPRSVLEAMAMGRPILTTDAPGCRETVVDGVNGWMVPVCDAGALAGKMAWMIENPKARQEMGAKSYEIAHEKFEVDKVNTVMIQHMELSA
jgi:glycosyltransferase involved in cell wall biosynthesis